MDPGFFEVKGITWEHFQHTLDLFKEKAIRMSQCKHENIIEPVPVAMIADGVAMYECWCADCGMFPLHKIFTLEEMAAMRKRAGYDDNQEIGE